jgi:hypothetical protein
MQQPSLVVGKRETEGALNLTPLRGLKSIDLPGQSRDLSGRGILVEDTLGVGFLDKRDRLQQSLLGTFKIFILSGDSHFFYKGLNRSFNVEVSKPPFFILPGPFDRR